MAKIDELVEKAENELLGKKIGIIELDNTLKDMFKAKNSLFTNIKDWVINNSSDETKITYCYHVQREHVVYVTFKVCKNKYDMLLSWMNVIVTNIERR